MSVRFDLYDVKIKDGTVLRTEVAKHLNTTYELFNETYDKYIQSDDISRGDLEHVEYFGECLWYEMSIYKDLGLCSRMLWRDIEDEVKEKTNWLRDWYYECLRKRLTNESIEGEK